MNFNDFLQQVLFSIGNHEVTVRQLISWGIVLIGTFLIYQLVIKKVLPKYFAQEKYVIRDNSKILKSIRNIFALLAMIGSVWALEVDFLLYQMKNVGIRISTVLYALTIWQVAGMLDWLASKVLVYNYHRSRNDLDYQTTVEKYAKETDSNAGNLVRLVVYAAAIFLVLQSFNLESYTIYRGTNTQIRVSDILEALLIILTARLIFWMVTQLVLFRYYKRSKINSGSQYAINQLLKYVIYTMALLWAISSLGIQMTVLWGGAAALLVGIGLGLQQTFNDFFSGIVLLFERSVEIGHVLDIGGLVGTVKEIGLRTSLIETRDSITVVVPNSKLVTDNVINWSHLDEKVRFLISVGVAYGSDTKLVKKILLDIAAEHPEIVEHPNPFVRFTNFGNSSLDFELHFFSRNFIRIEDVKSDLRFEIDNAFRENDVEIPFPQRVVWMKGDQDVKK
ncbi:MAG: mechanosensitive ion channel family protein [Saprospiraceae bacterium]